VPQVLSRAPDSEHTIYRFEAEGEPLGTVVMPVLNSMPADAVMSLRRLDLHTWTPDRHIDFTMISQSSVLTAARNEAVQKMRGDWLLFIDSDMTYDADAVQRLVESREEHDLDIVGGLCFRRSHPYQPTMYMREKPDSGMYNFLESWEPDSMVEVDATGMAFCIIHKRVFEKIAGTEMPPYAARQELGLPQFFKWVGQLGEDLRFCQDAKAAGCHIFVDTSIKIGHVGERIVTEREFLIELALRPEEFVHERRRANAAMGLPTASREDALERVRNL
jgi:hypothetical protein